MPNHKVAHKQHPDNPRLTACKKTIKANVTRIRPEWGSVNCDGCVAYYEAQFDVKP